MKQSNGLQQQELYDRRRLILARRMVTRTRTGAACAPCKSRKTRCSDYRPCARCRNLLIDGCFREYTPSSSFIIPETSSYFSVRDHSKFREDGLKEADMTGSFTTSGVMAPDQLARISCPTSGILLQTQISTALDLVIQPPQLASHSSTIGFPHVHQDPRQVPPQTAPKRCSST